MNKVNLIKIFTYFILTVFTYSMSFVVKGVALNNITREFNNPLFELDYLTNTGAAFSSFGHSAYVLAGVAIFVLFYIFFYICYHTHKLNYYKILLLAIFSAGIAANLFERLRYGFVTDYISVKPFPFPVFNFQDILIVVSGALLVIACLRIPQKKKKAEVSDDIDSQN